MALEVKYQQQENLNGWWRQCKDQAGVLGVEPILFYRKNGAKWKVRMFGYLVSGDVRVRTPVDIGVEGFLAYFRIRVKKELPLL